jgi:hypothetical protein
VVRDAEEMESLAAAFLENEEQREGAGRKAREFVLANRGAIEKSIDDIASLLDG